MHLQLANSPHRPHHAHDFFCEILNESADVDHHQQQHQARPSDQTYIFHLLHSFRAPSSDRQHEERNHSCHDCIGIHRHGDMSGLAKYCDISQFVSHLRLLFLVFGRDLDLDLDLGLGLYDVLDLGLDPDLSEIGRAVQQECRDRSRMPSSA
eukprot:TRINITY_DN6725_c0_g1_i4.p1 TRINITY_DN6725_c0_g1~~TRINITY_DN6725_c0_g1_i4.p1  ORF type:complete len:152 (+),score=21.59 TRINITY_DN6725_c0_g1_i4:244-699(+)